jgi:tripeptide aminopeptidase
VDLRSESEDEIVRLEAALRDSFETGIKDEMDNARERSRGRLTVRFNLIGSRPGGELATDSALLNALRAADDAVGNQSRIERSSTDANIPMSLGIDALAIGAGGNGGGAHSLQEWYEAAGREVGLKRALLTLLGVSGVAETQGQGK